MQNHCCVRDYGAGINSDPGIPDLIAHTDSLRRLGSPSYSVCGISFLPILHLIRLLVPGEWWERVSDIGVFLQVLLTHANMANLASTIRLRRTYAKPARRSALQLASIASRSAGMASSYIINSRFID